MAHPHQSAPPAPPSPPQEVSRPLSRPGNELILPPLQAHLLNPAFPKQDVAGPPGQPRPHPSPGSTLLWLIRVLWTGHRQLRKHLWGLPLSVGTAVSCQLQNFVPELRAAGGGGRPRRRRPGVGRPARRALPRVAGPAFILALSHSGESLY